MIVGILLIVLGILACGIGAGRALDEGRPPATPSPSPTARAELGVIPAAAVRAADIAVSPSVNCTRTGKAIQITTQCLITIQPDVIRPLELRLLVTTGTARFTVTQRIRGDDHTSDPSLVPATSVPASPVPQVRIKVSVSEVRTLVQCQFSATCALLVIE